MTVVVIGGGLAGLVAAADLAARGLQVELLERHRRLGGLCSSFRRRGHTFEAAAHAVGGCGPGGTLRRVLESLDVWRRLEMVAADPVDVVASPEYQVRVWRDPERFVAELAAAFPLQADRLARLVGFLAGFGPAELAEVAEATFADVLDRFGVGGAARTVFMAPLGNVGTPSDRVAASTACVLWRDNQLAGGWAPRGGFQQLSDAVAARAAELGATLVTGVTAERIEVAGGRVQAVMVRDGNASRRIPCRAVVAAGGVPQMLLEAAADDVLPPPYRDRIASGEPSFAGAVLCLGVAADLASQLGGNVRTWWVERADPAAVDEAFRPRAIAESMFAQRGPLLLSAPSLLDPGLAPAGATTLSAIVPAVWRPEPFWEEHAERLRAAALARVRRLVPVDESAIRVCELATPATVERYTANHRGAWYGWAPTVAQSGSRRLAPTTPIGGLVLAGHWTRPGPGLVNAAASGRLAARLVRRWLAS